MHLFQFEQYSPEWWKARRGKPTASNAKRIVTPAKWEFASAAQSYADELVAEEHDPYYGLDLERYATREMRAGTLAETKHREWYQLATDQEVQEVGFCLSDCERFGCSPDGLVGEEGGLEIKRPQPHTQVRYLRDGDMPSEYLAQVHMSLFVTDRPWWDFLSLCPGLPPLLVRVEPGEKTELLGECLERFHDLLQQTRETVADCQLA